MSCLSRKISIYSPPPPSSAFPAIALGSPFFSGVGWGVEGGGGGGKREMFAYVTVFKSNHRGSHIPSSWILYFPKPNTSLTTKAYNKHDCDAHSPHIHTIHVITVLYSIHIQHKWLWYFTPDSITLYRYIQHMWRDLWITTDTLNSGAYGFTPVTDPRCLLGYSS